MRSAAPIRIAEAAVPGRSPENPAPIPAGTRGSGRREVPDRAADAKAALEPNPRTVGTWAGWLEIATSPRVCASVIGVSLVLLVYSVLTGSSMMRRVPKPAVAVDGTVTPLPESPIDPAALDALREAAGRARVRLVADGKEVQSILEVVEAAALRLGWRMEMALAPPVQSPGGWRELTGYQAILQLTPASATAPAAFPSLVQWIEEVSRMPKHVEVVELTYGRDQERRWFARATIEMLGPNNDGQTSSE